MAMTTPVITVRNEPSPPLTPTAGGGGGGGGGGELAMEFVMPLKYSGRPLSELPRPADPSVSLDVRPPVRVAVRSPLPCSPPPTSPLSGPAPAPKTA